MKRFFQVSAFYALCVLLISSQASAQWVQTNGLNSCSVTALAATATSAGGSILYAATEGGIFASLTNGSSWTNISFGFSGSQANALLVLPGIGSSIPVLLAGTGSGVYRTTNNGNNWVVVYQGNDKDVRAFAASANNVGGYNLFAGTSLGGMYLSRDSGATWQSIKTGLTCTRVFYLAVNSNGTGGSNIFAATDSGVFISTNSGSRWSAVNTGLGSHISIRSLAVNPASGGTTSSLFAGASDGFLFLSTNSGTNWTAANSGLPTGNLACVSALAVSGTNLLAGTTGNGVYLSSNNGASWVAVDSGLANITIQALLVSSSASGTNVFSGTYAGGVFLSTNSGSSWIPANAGLSTGLLTDILSVAVTSNGSGGTNLFAGTYSGDVFLSTNCGTTWAYAGFGLPHGGTGIEGEVTALTSTSTAAGGINLFAGTSGGGGNVYKTTNNGTSWVQVSSGLPGDDVEALSSISNSTGSVYLYAGTARRGVYVSTNNGANWSAANFGLTNPSVYSLTAGPNGKGGTNLYAGMWGGGICLSVDNGATWTPVNNGIGSNNTTHALAVMPNASGGSNVVAGTDNGAYISTDNGTTWIRQTSVWDNYIYGLAVTPNMSGGSVIFAGAGSGIYCSTNSGAAWTAADSGLPSGINVHALTVGLNGKGDTVVFVGAYNGVWRRSLSEMTTPKQPVKPWMSVQSPLGSQSLGQVQFVSKNEGWVVSGGGSLLHTTDAGSTWTIVKPAGTDTVGLNTDNVTGLNPMSFVNPTTGWVIATLGGFQKGGGVVLYKTTNGGATWNKQAVSGWSIGFGGQFVDATHGWIEVVNGTSSSFTYSILRTTDGGAQWTSVFTSSSVLSIPWFVDANNGWAISGMFNVTGTSIIHTTDGGITWGTQLTDNTPGNLSCIRFVDVNNGWVVGDSSKIFHTTNGGSSWTRISNAGIDKSSRVRSLFFLNSSVGWIGGQVTSGSTPPFILHTANAGGTWSVQGGVAWAPPNKSPLQSSPLGMFFVDATTGWMTTYYGDLVKTVTGGEATAVESGDSQRIPTTFALQQNYPNPFNPSTTIRFELRNEGNVTLKVFNTLGQLVATLVDEPKRAGVYQVQWNASGVPSGAYFYRLLTGGFTETRKMIVVK